MSTFPDYMEAVIRNDISTVKNSFKEEYLYHFEVGFNPFLRACNLGHIEMVKFFIEKGTDLTSDTSAGWNGLHWAANCGFVDVVMLLLENGIDKESETTKKYRPLHCAAINDQCNMLRFLLTKGCNYNARNKDNKTALDVAIDLGSEKCISLLRKWIEYDNIFNIVRQHQVDKFSEAFLHERVNVKEKSSGMTVVDVAIDSKSYECLEVVLGNDLDENVLSECVRYSLNKFLCPMDSFLSQYRLYKSIIFNLKDQFDDFATLTVVNNAWILTGESFLDVCVRFNRKDMSIWILQMILTEGQIFDTAEGIATKKGFIKIKNAIVKRRHFIESRSTASYNRMFIAVQDNRADVVRYIIEQGLVDANGAHHIVGVPLSFALALGFGECAQMLLNHGVNVNIVNKNNQTPLHVALENGMNTFSKTLVDQSNNVDHLDCFGFTALHLAIVSKDDNTCRLLLNKGANLVYPLKIPQGDKIDHRLKGAVIPLLETENSVTLSLKLHRTIMPSLMAALDIGSVNALTEDGSTLLHLATRLFLSDICVILIDKGANVNLVNDDLNAPLHSLFVESDQNSWQNEEFKKILRVLINGDADINLVNNDGKSPFRYAFQTGDREIITTIIDRTDRLEAEIEDFCTVHDNEWNDVLERMITVQSDDFKRQLIIRGIDDAHEELIDTIFGIITNDFASSIIEDCLYNAATADKETIFERCLTINVGQPKLFPCGETLLTKLISDHNDKYSLLLAKSDHREKFLDCPNRAGLVPLYLSAAMASLKLCKYLTIESQSLDFKDVNGETAMEILFRNATSTDDKAKLKKVEDIVKTMIRAGMDINRVNKAKVSAITFCQNESLKQKLQQFDEKSKQGRPRRPVDMDEDKNICDICLHNPINCQFGCGHPICRECANKLDFCPICRAPKGKIFPLYL